MRMILSRDQRVQTEIAFTYIDCGIGECQDHTRTLLHHTPDGLR